MSMQNRVLVIGETYTIPVTFYDEDGTTAYDMTNYVGMLRLRAKGTNGAVYVERLTSTAAQFTWTVQASGTGSWLFKSNESLTAGLYDASVWIYDTSSPIVRRQVGGTTTYEIKVPDTGSF